MRAASRLGGTALCAAALLRCSLATDFAGLEGSAADQEAGAPGSDAALATDGAASADGSAADGGVIDSGMGADGGIATRCSVGTPFGTPMSITELNTGSDDTSARLSADELTMHFASTRGGDFDLYRTTRSSVAAKFGTATNVSELNTSFNERSPSLKTGDLVIMFDSDREGGAGGRDIYLGLRNSTATPFGTILALGALNGTGDDARCFMQPDALSVYFESDRSASGDIYRATRANLQDSFSAPVLVTELASSAEDGYPVPSTDDLVVYFASSRSGGAGNFDIWVASRSTPQAAFGTPVRVTELATASDDIPTWLSPDLCRLYFISDRPGGKGNLDIYVAKRSP